MNSMLKIFFAPFNLIGLLVVFLFKRQLLNHSEGAKFAKPSEYHEKLNSRNKGLLLDGDSLKLAEKESFQNVCIIARVGAGKTSRYIIPNVLERAKSPCSVVVNDPKGEVYEQTSGYMRANGFRVIVIDPENLNRSHTFNPLTEAKDDIELDQIAEILIKAGKPAGNNNSGAFWESGAGRYVSAFLRCLRNAGQVNPAYNTLANLYYLFQNFGEDGSKLDAFMARYSIDPNDPSDRRLWNEWQGLLTGNKEGIQSFILNGITALKAMSNRNIAQLTAESSFSLDTFRERKTVVYFITPPQHQEYYSFLTSLFFRSVFNACMRENPTRDTLPVYVLYDEFGHSTIPNFVSTANTIRGYKVSLSIVLQSIAQLNARYGKDYAQSIQGGFNTSIAYSGSDLETSLFFEHIIGKTRIYQVPDYTNHMEHYREQNLLNSNEIRTIKSDEVLIVSGNQNPILIPSKAYFQVGRMKRATSKPPAPLDSASVRPLQYVPL